MVNYIGMVNTEKKRTFIILEAYNTNEKKKKKQTHKTNIKQKKTHHSE